MFALPLGAWAARLVLTNKFARIAAMQGGQIVAAPLAKAVAERKAQSPDFLDLYESFFLPMRGL